MLEGGIFNFDLIRVIKLPLKASWNYRLWMEEQKKKKTKQFVFSRKQCKQCKDINVNLFLRLSV